MKTSAPKFEHVEFLRSLKGLEAQYTGSWLPLDSSKAFIICVSSGPWKSERRSQVQHKVLNWYFNQEVKDLGEVTSEIPSDLFPFTWQTNMLTNLIKNLQSEKALLKDKCVVWRDTREDPHSLSWIQAIYDFFKMAGVSIQGTKVLWLFVRDHLQLPAFPIDRHVARNLEKYNLPRNAWYMVKACLEAGVSPNILNRCFFLQR